MAKSIMKQKPATSAGRSKLHRTMLMSTVAVVTSMQVAMAQEASTEVVTSDEDIVLEPISIDGKEDVLTGGVQLTAEEIERYDPQTLKDIFRQEPGVKVGSPNAVSQKIYVNGIEDTNLAVDIDGARQANKTYHHVGTTIVDPGMLKSIKVETGVAPADAGPGAMAGSISVETKDGRDLVEPGELYAGFAKVTYNSNTRGFSEDLAVGMEAEGFDILGYVTHENGDDYHDGDGEIVEGTSPAAENYLMKFGYTANNGYRIKFSANQFIDNATRSGRPNFLVSFGDPAPTEYRRQNFTLSFGDETPTTMWDPQVTLAYTDTELRTTVPLPFGSFAPLDIHADVRTVNGKVQNTFTTEYGKITTGFDYYEDHGNGGRAGYRGTETTDDLGIFVQGRMNITEDLRSSLGARYDWNDFEGADGTKFDDKGYSANLNLEYDLTNEVMFYGGGSTVFGAVPLSEVGFKQASLTYNDMKTSRSYNTKMGMVYEAGSVSFDGNVYSTAIDDANDIDDSNRGSVDNVTTNGFNLNLKYTYGDGFVRGGYSKAKVRVNSEVPTSTSSHYQGILMGDSMNLEIHHDLPDWGVRIGTTNEYFFENDDTEEALGYALEKYFVSNVYAEYNPEEIEDWTFRFDVRNLFDSVYAARTNVGADSTNSSVDPYNDPGRTVLLSAKLDF
ncbi:TonB-dependent receptor plug domain-containing protein [Curvivirga aplysinae]|uniref:TonB-dependent receptor plug domain-containing protein n=1 Tax=Curvivirga aplysinae TaxID=2529852 RepID=UPI0012BD5B7E|nr:TonB-dependent receptor [Curvivirga aplysinae]MTI08712.1 TonB-dependent receptor [Curvivirga aplysinae]